MLDTMLSNNPITPQEVVGGTHGQMFDIASTLSPGEYVAGTGRRIPSIFEGARPYSMRQNNTIVITVSTVPDDPIIEGTNIPIYQITALVDGGMKVENIIRDYPSLNKEQINYAVAFAKVFPNKLRQYPKVTFKELLRKMDFHDLFSKS